MSSNATLYNLRIKKGLSIHQAGKAAHVFWPLLYLFERGYAPIPKKQKLAFAALYEVDESVLEDPLGYPTPIENEEKTSPKKERLLKIAFSLPSFLSVLGIFVVCLSLFIWGFIGLYQVGEETQKVYSSDVLSLTSLVQAKGTDEEDGEKKSLAYLDADGTSLTIVTPKDPRLASLTSFIYLFPKDEEEITLTLSTSGSLASFSFLEAKNGDTLYTGSGAITDDHYVLKSLLDGNDEQVQSTQTFNEKATLISSYEGKTNPLFQKWANANSFNLTKNPHALLKDIGDGNLLLAKRIDLVNNLLLYSTLFGVLFLFLSVLVGVVYFLRKKKKKAYALVESVEELPSREAKPLPKNWLLQPVLPETLFRLAGVILILISSILLFKVAQQIFNAGDIFEMIDAAMNVLDWVKLLPLIPLGTTLWFFIRIEVLHTSENVLPSILLSFFLGLLYYAAENAFDLYFTLNSDTYRSTLLGLFLMFMPGNLFWGMTCFSLIVLFLLTTPNFKKKKSVLYWRLLSLLPIAYLLFSYLYALGVKLWGWQEMGMEVSGLFFHKQLVTTTFAILYPLALYFYRKLLVRKYGKENASLYFAGNHYYFVKNLLAASILGGLALASYLLRNSSFESALGLKQSYWIAVLIPFILLYHPHLGKRNPIVDLLFPLAYTISLSFAYLYIARFILFLV